MQPARGPAPVTYGAGRGRLSAFREGVAHTLGLAAGTTMLATMFGAAAVARGMPEGHALLMSATVFAGAAQFAAVELWATPPALLALALTTLLIGSRHVLMGATLPGGLARPGSGPPLGVLFLLTDPTWALTRGVRAGTDPRWFFIGSGTLLYAGWMAGTLVGVLLPGLLDPVTLEGMTAAGALFIVILLGILGRQDRGAHLLPWGVAAVIAFGLQGIVGGPVAIVVAVAASVPVVLWQGTHRGG